ncbi:MAG: helix-turn-helix domain-containing protein [Myxococcales bacterium]|nr:MAG: helix-turn-helix domain-containing protein [Myxococcales bacterium]
MPQRPRRIGLLVFDGITALDLVGPADAFGSARLGPEAAPRPAYELVVLGASRRPCRSETGLRLTPDRSMAEAPALDTLILPGGSGLREPGTNRLVAGFVRARARKLRRIAAVCTGIYGLAATGLLDGRRVTTHWAFADDVARRYPKLRMSADELFVKDGPFYTAAGVTSGIDLSLSLIEEDLGPSRALAVARELVVYMKRAGGQQQFSEPLRFQLATRERLRDLGDYVMAHLAEDLSVSALAKAFALSERQLSRACQSELGQSPAALVQRLRLDDARRRLLDKGASVEAVGSAVGFASADAFRRAFERSFGVNPSNYRLRFRATRAPRGRAVAP